MVLNASNGTGIALLAIAPSHLKDINEAATTPDVKVCSLSLARVSRCAADSESWGARASRPRLPDSLRPKDTFAVLTGGSSD